jgi:hypothetical protein
MDQNKEDLQYLCRKPREEYSKWGLTVNTDKTKYTSLCTDTNYLEVDSGDVIIGCTEYKKLGSIRPAEGRDNKNTPHRVTKARKKIDELNGIWWWKNITKWWWKNITKPRKRVSKNVWLKVF